MRVTDKNLQHSDWKVAQKKTLVWGQRCVNLVGHSPNSEPCPSSIWLFWRQNTAVTWFYLHQNTTSILVFYNGLISMKIPMVIWPYLHQNSTTFTIGLFPNSAVIWTCFHCLLTLKLHIISDFYTEFPFIWTPFSIPPLKHLLGDSLNYSFSYFMYLRLVVTVTFHSDHTCSNSWITPSALFTLSNLFQYRLHTSSLPQISLLNPC